MAERKVFQDSVTPLPVQGGLTPHGLLVQSAKEDHGGDVIRLAFSLGLAKEAQADLERAVASGTKVSALPKPPDPGPLVSWLKGQGFREVEPSETGTSVYASGTADQISQALEVNMVRVTKGGLTYTSAQNAPSLPADVGASVQSIVGLQPFRHAHKHSKVRPAKGNNRVAGADGNGPTTNVQNAPPYLVPEILAAYNAKGTGLTGKGQTIAILIDTVPSMHDVQAFWSRNGITPDPSRIQTVNVTGSSLPAPSGEETLDVEWASGVAPGATIKVYASGSLQFADLDQALDQIIADASKDPTLRQVSISLGLGETFSPAGEIVAQHQKFLQLAALGVNVFVSSGDAGSNPDGSGHTSGGPLQVEYQSSDPCVVSVGGTTLKLAGSGAVSSETGWASGGGGKSVHFQRPSWQAGSKMPSASGRMVPDVSLTADPDEGAFLVLNGKVQQIGGTSWSAPVWAAFCALINEARGKAKKESVAFLNPVLYPLLGTAGYETCFRDVTAGSNGAYEAGPGYDMVTGLGVPNLTGLIAHISGLP